MNVSHHPFSKLVLTLLACTLFTSLLGCGGPGSKANEIGREIVRDRHRANLSALAAQKAEQDFRVGNLKDALASIDNAIRVQPTNPAHFVMRGRILFEMNELQAARSSFNHAILLNESAALPQYYLGLVYQRWSNDTEANNHYARATELAPTKVEFGLAYVESLIALNELTQAHQFIADTLVQFEHEPAFKRVEGHLFLIENRPADAATSFYQAMLLDPDNIRIVESLIHAYIQAGDYAHSQYYLERLLNNPRTSDRADLKHLMARCLAASDRLVEAREAYIELTNQNRMDPVLWNELGIVAMDLGDHRRAAKVARTMISMWPRQIEGYLLNARIFEVDQNFTAAIQNYRKAESLDQNREEIFIFLGMALEKNGDYQQARIVYTRALTLNPQNPGTSQLLKGLEQRRTLARTAAVSDQ